MGYISKVFILDEYDIEIASMDLGKVYFSEWLDQFGEYRGRGLTVNFAGIGIPEEYQDDYPGLDYVPDIRVKKDAYGNPITACNAVKMLDWLKTADTKKYSTLGVLKGFLTALKKNNSAFADYQVVHYGE